MNYRNFHDRMYKSWTPEYTAIKSRSEERGWVAFLIIVVGILTVIFS